jgi:hypothetical protein
MKVPYTTHSGLQIGSRYDPPRFNEMTAEDEHWQGVLLGNKRKSVNEFAVVVIAVLVIIAAVVLTA